MLKKIYGPHLHLIVIEANHSQGFPHYLPIAAVVDGAHFGTVALEKHKHNMMKWTPEAKPTEGGPEKMTIYR